MCTPTPPASFSPPHVPPSRISPSTYRPCLVLFGQGHPPTHRRFDDKKIPRHITYAYKSGVTIARNDDFYEFQQPDQKKTIDVLFVMASAPVKTGSLPEAGSEPYMGAAIGMQLATEALSEKFPSFFGAKNML